MTDYTELTHEELQAKRDEFEKAMLEAKMDILKLTTNEAKAEAQEIINGYKNDLQEIMKYLNGYYDELTQEELQEQRDELERTILTLKADMTHPDVQENKESLELAQTMIDIYKAEIDELLEQYDDLDGDLVDGVDYGYNMELDRSVYLN